VADHERALLRRLYALFEAAVIEILTYPPAAAAILDHPLVNVTLMTDNPDGTVTHTVLGEERGLRRGHEVVLSKKVTDIWKDDAWHATPASKYVLECDDGHFTIRALYWDISDSPPPPIAPPVCSSPIARAVSSASAMLISMLRAGPEPMFSIGTQRIPRDKT
jgi:hypothetical protein